MSNEIALGVIDLSFHRITAALVVHVLTRMGFKVKRVYANHEETFNNLAEDRVDMLASAWLPSSHGIYKKEVEKQVALIGLGQHYNPYAFWGVPDYVPVVAVSSVYDLLKPEVIEKMNPVIQGIQPGAGIPRFSIKMMEHYGLAKAGYQFFTGTEMQCVAAFEEAVNQKQWVTVPLWKPHYLHYQYHIREIKEPDGLLGTVDQAVLLLRADKKAYFTDDQLRILDALRFSNEIIAKLDYKVSRKSQDIDQVAAEFMYSFAEFA